MALSIDGVSFLVFLWLVVLTFWPSVLVDILLWEGVLVLKWASKWLFLLLWLAVYFTLRGCVGPASGELGQLCTSLEARLFVTWSCHDTDECSTNLSPSLWVFLALHHFLPLLWLVKVASSAVLAVSVSGLLLWENISPWEGVVVLVANTSLWEGVLVLQMRIIVSWFFEFLSNWGYLPFTSGGFIVT